MKILAIEGDVEGVKAEDFTIEILKREAMEAWGLQQKGIIRELSFDDDHNAILILEAESIAVAKAALDKLPLVQEKLVRFELRAMYPYNGYERLFCKE